MAIKSYVDEDICNTQHQQPSAVTSTRAATEPEVPMQRAAFSRFHVMAYSALAILCSTSLTSHADNRANTTAGRFVHPGIAHTRASIDFVREKIDAEEEPWARNWDVLDRSDYASLQWEPKPRSHVERGAYNHPNIGSSEFSADGKAAYTHALHWALSGDQKHARKSAQILNAWSAKLRTVTNHDAKLLVGMSGYTYCNAAEILKHTWSGWTKGDQKQFDSMLLEVWHPIIRDFFPSANGNWDASIMQTMMAMAVFLDNREMFDRATHYFKEGEGNGALRNYFNDFGQCQESGRDQGHTQMGLDFLANACEIAWNQQVDLYGEADNRLLKGFEYTAKYNLGFEVPYEPFESYDGRYLYKHLSDDGRGKLRPMYHKVYNHYHHRRGLDAPFTQLAADKTRPEWYARCSLPWGALMFNKTDHGENKSK